jgi:hypothetical protein
MVTGNDQQSFVIRDKIQIRGRGLRKALEADCTYEDFLGPFVNIGTVMIFHIVKCWQKKHAIVKQVYSRVTGRHGGGPCFKRAAQVLSI